MATFPRTLSLAVALFCATPVFPAENSDAIKVGDMEFKRPVGWQAEDGGNSKQLVFKVKDEAGAVVGDADVQEIRLGEVGTLNYHIHALFREFEDRPAKPQVRVEVIDGRKFTFLEAEGTHVNKELETAKQRRPNQSLRAVIVERSSKDIVVLRVIGDKAKAEDAGKALRAAVVGK